MPSATSSDSCCCRGQRYDTIGVAPLIEGVEFGALIADKAFDANWIIAEMNARGAGIVISQRPNRLNPFRSTWNATNGAI